jgi:membrane-associated phospholipid phosphatase
MSRGVGITTLDFPSGIVVIAAVVTQLGDLWFAFSVCALAYWLGPQLPHLGLTRARAVMVIAVLIGVATLTVSLKAMFALPRPPGAATAPEAAILPAVTRELYISMATGDGYGFPSGHATVAVALWGGLAWAVRVGTRQARVAVAGAVIVLIGLSRLILGVHYFVDVLTGAAIAGGFLWLALTRLRTPGRVLWASTAIAVGGLLVGGLSRDIGAVVGLSVGAAVVWQTLPDVPEPSRRGAVITTGVGTVTGGLLATAWMTLWSTPLSGLVIGAVGIALLLALPLVGERVAKK